MLSQGQHNISEAGLGSALATRALAVGTALVDISPPQGRNRVHGVTSEECAVLYGVEQFGDRRKGMVLRTWQES